MVCYSSPMPIVDVNGKVIAVFAGHPADPVWEKKQHEACEKLEKARETIQEKDSNQTPRRGEFKTMRCGVSHGGGQKKPQNLCNNKQNEEMLKELNGDPFFQSLASYVSCR